MNNINVWPAFKSKAVTKNTAYTSPVLDLAPYSLNGFFSAHILLSAASGAPNIKLQWGTSNTNDNFVYSADAGDDIVTSFLVGSGPESDGENMYSFDPMTAQYLQIKATEGDNSGATIVLSVYIAMH